MLKATLLAAVVVAASALEPVLADPMVGGAVMSANRNIIQNAENSKVHTTLVAAVKAGGLVETLEGAGPFTVFAPTNDAFNALPAGTMQNLLKPANKKKLDAILTYNVVPGRLDVGILDQYIKDGGGKAELKTLEGSMLTVTGSGDDLMIIDAKGETANITIPNVYQSNGVIMVTNKVLMPS